MTPSWEELRTVALVACGLLVFGGLLLLAFIDGWRARDRQDAENRDEEGEG